MTVSEDLARLAAAHGVATEYTDQLRRTITVKQESVVAVLGALGVDATSRRAITAALKEVEHPAARPAVVVHRQGERVALPAGRVLLEDGTEVAGSSADTPLGWHCIVSDDGLEIPYVVTPQQAPLPTGRHWGLSVQLYATRSAE